MNSYSEPGQVTQCAQPAYASEQVLKKVKSLAGPDMLLSSYSKLSLGYAFKWKLNVY